VTGATKGHLTKHDDFVFTGSCSRPTEVLSPSAEPPATGEHEPPSRMGAISLASPAGDLPFTGGRALYLFLAGSVLIASGLALLRRKPTPYRRTTNASTGTGPEPGTGLTAMRCQPRRSRREKTTCLSVGVAEVRSIVPT
jgi:hypothetical protein